MPNPFNLLTTVHFKLAIPGPARLRVYDVRGHLVWNIVNGILPAGENDPARDGTDDQGRAVASGKYMYRLQSPDGELGRRMMLMRRDVGGGSGAALVPPRPTPSRRKI